MGIKRLVHVANRYDTMMNVEDLGLLQASHSVELRFSKAVR
jgi:hypothetical protein